MSLIKKIARAILFSVLDSFVENVSPKYFPMVNTVKRICLLLMGAKIGSNPFIDKGVDIRFPNGLTVGDNVVLSKNVLITTGGSVYIGNNVLIGYSTKILSGNHIIPGDINQPIRFSGHLFERVVIEDNVWVGAEVVILPGVRVGKNSVVAAGAVVTKDVQPDCIVAGVPARVLRYRNDEH